MAAQLAHHHTGAPMLRALAEFLAMTAFFSVLLSLYVVMEAARGGF